MDGLFGAFTMAAELQPCAGKSKRKEDSTFEQPASKRKRKVLHTYAKLACVSCREKKAKCNGERPCFGCVKHGKGGSCYYVGKTKPRGRPAGTGGRLSQRSEKERVQGSSDGSRSQSSGDLSDDLTDLSREERAARSFNRRSVMAVYTEKVAPVAVQWVGDLAMVQKTVESNYEELWWNGEVDLVLAHCNTIYYSIALNALGAYDEASDLMRKASMLLCNTLSTPTLPAVLSLMSVGLNGAFDSPNESHRIFGLVRATLPFLDELKGESRQKEIGQLTGQVNFFLKLTKPAEVFPVDSDFPLRPPHVLDELTSQLCFDQVSIDNTVWVARLGMIFFLQTGVIAMFGGKVIQNVDIALRECATFSSVKEYGLLHCLQHPSEIVAHPNPKDVNGNLITPSYAIECLAAYLRLLKAAERMVFSLGIDGRPNFDEASQFRFRCQLNQLLFSCRTVTIAVMWWSGERQLANETMCDFLRNREFDFTGGAAGSYVLPLAMLLEVAIDSGELHLVDMVRQHIEKRAKTWSVYRDQRKDDLVTVARMWCEHFRASEDEARSPIIALMDGFGAMTD